MPKKIIFMGTPDIATQHLNILIENKMKINSYLHDGLWIDIGTTEEYLNLIENLEEITKDNPSVPISS